MRTDLPSGTVTFLFTDVEGSTRLLRELGEEAYAEALAEHRRLIRETCARHHGVEVDMQGDAFFYAFPTVAGALRAAFEGQAALEAGPIRVRLGLHTGTPLVTDEGYVGHDVHFAARVAACGHGGQTLLSKETASLLDGAPLTSLGSHRLGVDDEPVTIYQLGERRFPRLKTIANSNLPLLVSTFLGREDELYEADRFLPKARLLTVTGPGGVGKTRFALELATRVRDERFGDYEDGVYSAFLSSLRDPKLVLVTVAAALGVVEQPGQSVAEALASHLQGKKLLLLLDNLEHLLEAAPELSALLSVCPDLTIIATSRARLRLQGERVYALPPLSAAESVLLFCERAQTEPDDNTRELCQKLEGLPLAIELAAARTSALNPMQISSRLSQRLDFLKGGLDRDPRQETLRATIEWSYGLLTSEERQLLSRLSVFQGGCTLEAAEEVCDAEVDALQSLVDKSLLRFTDWRYWLLDTIREFAAERLEASGDAKEIGQRQAKWVVTLSEEARREFTGPAQESWLDRLAEEQGNVRTAVAWLREADQVDQLLDLLVANFPYWNTRGGWGESLGWVEHALARSEGQRSSARAWALLAAARGRMVKGEHDSVISLTEESLVTFRELGDERGMGAALVSLGVTQGNLGHHMESRKAYEEAREHLEAAGHTYGLIICEANLAYLALEEGDFGIAVSVAQHAVDESRTLDIPDLLVSALSNLALGCLLGGNSKLSISPAREGATISRQIKDLDGLTSHLTVLAAVAATVSRDEAARLVGSVQSIQREHGVAPPPIEASLLETTIGGLRSDLGEQRYEALVAEGAALTLDEAVAYALEVVPEPEAG